MRVLFSKRFLSPVAWSRIQAAGLLCLLAVVGQFYYRAVARPSFLRRGLYSHQTGRVTRVSRALPSASLTRLGLPQSSTDRRYKLSLAEYGLETLDQIEYAESGVRVSKGCYVFRSRPVFVETMLPHLPSLSDPSVWQNVLWVNKVGLVVIVRLGEPISYTHLVQPLVGAWHVRGRIPGMLSRQEIFVDGVFSGVYAEQRHLATILNPETIDRERLAMYEARGTRPCRREP